MGAFDRELAKRVKAALQQGDIKAQGARMNEMISGVTQFAQNVADAKAQIANESVILSEHSKLKRTSDRTEEDENRFRELEADLAEVADLKREYHRSRGEVRELAGSVERLNGILRKL